MSEAHEIDPWVLPRWTQSARCQCDGCGRRCVPTMFVAGGGGICMCESCHGEFMAAWRAEDAASELAECCADSLFFQLGTPEPDDELAPATLRSAA